MVQQPYNPYGGAASAPAPSYGYNPYTQAPYGGPGPTMAPPPGPAPVYYPPPPRKPLLKPETSAFLKKLTVSFIVLGTFFALLMVGVWALFQQISRIQDTKNGASYVEAVKNIDPNLPPEERIAKLKALKSKLGKNADSGEIDRALGREYVGLAEAEKSAGRSASAEPYLQQAYGFDPTTPTCSARYGEFFAEQAGR